MKEKIAEMYAQALYDDLPPNVFADQVLRLFDVSGSLQDIKEVIDFLQWVFRKVDKGDTPEETVRMLLMNRAKIDNIKFVSFNFI